MHRGWAGILAAFVCAVLTACGTARLPAQDGPSMSTSMGIVAAPGNNQRPEVFAAIEGGHLVYVRWPQQSPSAVAGTLAADDDGQAPQQIPFMADAFPQAGKDVVLTDRDGSKLADARLSTDGTVLSVRLANRSTLHAIDRPVLRLQAVTEGEFDELIHGFVPARLR